MKRILLWIGTLLTVVLGTVLAVAQTYEPASSPSLVQLVEQRYCGIPTRNKDGTINRSSTVIRAFRKEHPCPVTGETTGACPGWSIDHVIPLACGGCDAVSNMQWLPNELKSCTGNCKDRFERKIYCTPFQPVK